MPVNFDKISGKLDKSWLGFILAAIIPIITLFMVFLYRFNYNYSFKEFIDFLYSMQILSKLFSLCVLPNLGLFFLFIWGNLLHGARGTIAGTFFITFVILIVQFVL